jgi:hypothetical protein
MFALFLSIEHPSFICIRNPLATTTKVSEGIDNPLANLSFGTVLESMGDSLTNSSENIGNF